MVLEVSKEIGKTIVELFKLTDQIFTEVEGWEFFIAAFIIVTISRFLLVPLLRGNIGGIGAIGSDMVKRGIDNYLDSDSKSDKAKGKKK